MPPNVRFIGGVLASEVDVWTSRPRWWSELEKNEGRTDVIAVTKGTMDIDYMELVIQVIEALRDRQIAYDRRVVLGWRGASLPEEIAIPARIHGMDYVPYTDLLKHSTLFVTNCGCNGVPILKAGNDGDKMATGNRIEWAGCRLDLETVLKDPQFKARALEIQEEAKMYDPISLIVEEIEATAAGESIMIELI